MTELIERQLELPASLAEVWRALTDERWLSTWLADEASLDLFPGGDARFVVDGEERGGWVEEVSPPCDGGPGRLVFWWGVDDEPATRVELTAAADDDVTVLRVVETRPLERLDTIGTPLPGVGGDRYGPVMLAA